MSSGHARGITAGSVQIGPGSGDQGACAIGQDQHELEFTATTLPAYDVQCPSLERVVRPQDRYLLRVALKVVMGSVSMLRSSPARSRAGMWTEASMLNPPEACQVSMSSVT